MQINPDDVSMLIELLAATDALFAIPRTYSPLRLLGRAAMASVLRRREDFQTLGINDLGGGSAAERKAVERRINNLQAAGQLTVSNRGGRRIGCRLTEHGDDLARWYACMPLYHEAFPLLTRLALLVEHGVCMKGEMVSELDLALIQEGMPDYWEQHFDMEEKLTVLKVRGLTVESLNGHGHCFFSLTDAGKRALKRKPPQPPKLPKYKSYMDDYLLLFKSKLEQRDSLVRPVINDIFIPLSCGIGPEKSWTDLDAATVAKLRAAG